MKQTINPIGQEINTLGKVINNKELMLVHLHLKSGEQIPSHDHKGQEVFFTIVTDTNMALSGINKKYLAKFGGQAHCFMADDEVALIAKEKKTTRAAVSMEFASRIDKPVIFAIGNAPTALIELYDMIEKGIYKPAFVIGVPVGFVNVEAAKELIMETGVPYIVNVGRKGGSNIAAAICNALIYSLVDRG